MIVVGRRGFILGLTALVAAPAVIRVAPLMRISSRFTPLYVPAHWIGLDIVRSPTKWALGGLNLKEHAWPKRLDETWVDITDYDPAYVKGVVEMLDQEPYWGIWTG